MRMRRSKAAIYQSEKHLAVTLFFVALPFIFLLAFTRSVGISAGNLLADVSISFLRLLAAYLIAATLAWVAAVSLYKGRRAMIALPIFDVLQSFPTFAALPLAALLLGKTNFTVILFLVITIVWPIFFSITSSLKLIKAEWDEVIQVNGLSGKNYLRLFVWPASLPGLITGSIIGLGEGWEALVATEIIIGMQNGLGSFFSGYSNDPLITLFGIVGFLLLIFTINKLIWLPLLEWAHSYHDE